MEVTIVFHTYIEAAHARKMMKYSFLPDICKKQKWHETIHMLQGSSTGLTEYNSFEVFQSFMDKTNYST